MDADKTIVLGLDGGHFELLKPWLEDGELPNIQSMIETGVSTETEVCLPPVTSPNWKCYSTGKNPGKIGIFWWENIDTSGETVYFPSQRKNDHKEIWDYLSEEGYEVCVLGTPLTYPPKEVNGVLISGGLDSGDDDYTYPGTLQAELEERFNYRVHPETDIHEDKEEAASQILELIDLRFEVARELMEEQEPDFVQITSFYLNVLQHFFWDADVTKQGWKIIDQHLGELLADDVNVVLMSDHGSNEIQTVFNINTWLNKEGYLSYNTTYDIAKGVSRLDLTQGDLERVAEKLHLKHIANRVVPDRVINLFPSSGGEIKQESKSDKIDWKKSDAVASGQGPIYILNQKKRSEIKRKLENLSGPGGKGVLRDIYDTDEIYSGPYLDQAPDLIMDQAAHTHIKGGIGLDEIFEDSTEQYWEAENKKQGFFVANGPDFQGSNPEQMSILDIAPTLLKLYGIDRPVEMDGRVVIESVTS